MYVYDAIVYEKEDRVNAMQWLVPEKSKIRFDDAQVDLEEGVDNSATPNQTLCY